MLEDSDRVARRCIVDDLVLARTQRDGRLEQVLCDVPEANVECFGRPKDILLELPIEDRPVDGQIEVHVDKDSHSVDSSAVDSASVSLELYRERSLLQVHRNIDLRIV